MTNQDCPLCRKENKCGIHSNEPLNCWCTKETFPEELLDLVPDESKRKQCICKDCLNTFKKEPK